MMCVFFFFSRACYNGRYECAKTLLMYGGSRILLKENLWYETPLHAACTSGYSIDLVNYLAEQEGIFINHQVFKPVSQLAAKSPRIRFAGGRKL